MNKLLDYLAGYKTKILAFATALINLLQVFNITNMSEQQIGALNIVLATGIVLAIRDTVTRVGNK